eukprot:13004520-Alexandrium_andersonii.AAC.1
MVAWPARCFDLSCAASRASLTRGAWARAGTEGSLVRAQTVSTDRLGVVRSVRGAGEGVADGVLADLVEDRVDREL